MPDTTYGNGPGQNPLPPPQPTDPGAANLQKMLAAAAIVIVFILATIVALLRGNPAPSFPPLNQNAPAATATP